MEQMATLKLGGNANAGVKPPERAAPECNVATMATGNIERDGHTKPRTTRLGVARVIEAIEGPENIFELVFWDAGAIIINREFDELPRFV